MFLSIPYNIVATTTGDTETTSLLPMLIGIAAMALLMWLLVFRPQKKKEKKQAEQRNSLEIGDEVTTIGGIVGRVVNLKEDTFVLETSGERSRLRFKRWAIQDVDKLSLEGDSEPSTESSKLKAE